MIEYEFVTITLEPEVIYSFSLLWHSNSPTLTAVSNNEICVSETFNFVINSAYQNGIGRNYFGSYYTIDWGDSSEIEYYTHAFILAYNNLFETQSIEIENNHEKETYNSSDKILELKKISFQFNSKDKSFQTKIQKLQQNTSIVKTS